MRTGCVWIELACMSIGGVLAVFSWNVLFTHEWLVTTAEKNRDRLLSGITDFRLRPPDVSHLMQTFHIQRQGPLPPPHPFVLSSTAARLFFLLSFLPMDVRCHSFFGGLRHVTKNEGPMIGQGLEIQTRSADRGRASVRKNAAGVRLVPPVTSMQLPPHPSPH